MFHKAIVRSVISLNDDIAGIFHVTHIVLSVK
jgi:hypothetical protein